MALARLTGLPGSGQAPASSGTVLPMLRPAREARAAAQAQSDSRALLGLLGSAETAAKIASAALASGAKGEEEVAKFASYCQRLALAELGQHANPALLGARPESVRDAVVQLAAIGLPLCSAGSISRLIVEKDPAGQSVVRPVRMARGFVEMLRTFARRTAEAVTDAAFAAVEISGEEFYAQDQAPEYGVEGGERIFRYRRNLAASPSFHNAANTLVGAFATVRVGELPLFAVVRSRAEIEARNPLNEEARVLIARDPASFYVGAVTRELCNEWVRKHAVISSVGQAAIDAIERSENLAVGVPVAGSEVRSINDKEEREAEVGGEPGPASAPIAPIINIVLRSEGEDDTGLAQRADSISAESRGVGVPSARSNFLRRGRINTKP